MTAPWPPPNAPAGSPAPGWGPPTYRSVDVPVLPQTPADPPPPDRRARRWVAHAVLWTTAIGAWLVSVAPVSYDGIAGQVPNPLALLTFALDDPSGSPSAVSILGVVVVAGLAVAVVVLAPPRRLVAVLPVLLVAVVLDAVASGSDGLSEGVASVAYPAADLAVVLLVNTAWVLASRRSLLSLVAVLVALPGAAVSVGLALLGGETDIVRFLTRGYPVERTGFAVVFMLLCFAGPAWLAVLLDRVAARRAAAAPPVPVPGASGPGGPGGPPGPGGPGGPPGAQVPGAPGRTNQVAVAALVLSFVFTPAAIVCGHVARSQIRRTGEAGAGMALGALIFSYASLALVVVTTVALLAVSLGP